VSSFGQDLNLQPAGSLERSLVPVISPLQDGLSLKRGLDDSSERVRPSDQVLMRNLVSLPLHWLHSRFKRL